MKRPTLLLSLLPGFQNALADSTEFLFRKTGHSCWVNDRYVSTVGMTHPFILLPLLLPAVAQANPQLTSRFTQNSGSKELDCAPVHPTPAMDSYRSQDSTSRYHQYPMNTQTATGPVAAAILLCMETYFPQHRPADEPAARGADTRHLAFPSTPPTE